MYRVNQHLGKITGHF